MNEAAKRASDSQLLTQYGCGPIRFSGDNNALYERHLLFDDVVALDAAGPRERFEAAARAVRDVASQRWILTESTYDQENPKRIYYLSMEFLIGRSLSNNITNLLLNPFAREVAAQEKLDPLGLIEQEADAGLGNGGLGRLAACFLELDGDDAAPGDGVRAALRIRHVQTVHPGRLAARRAGQLAAPPRPVGGPAPGRGGRSRGQLLDRAARRALVPRGRPTRFIDRHTVRSTGHRLWG